MPCAMRNVPCAQQCCCPARRVVPSCYRRNFPAQLKSHRSHDVVLLCFECHQTAHKVGMQLSRAAGT